MLECSYSFAIEDLEDKGSKSAEEERLRARQLALVRKRRQLRVVKRMLEIGVESRVSRNERRKRRLRLPPAAADRDIAAPLQPKPGRKGG